MSYITRLVGEFFGFSEGSEEESAPNTNGAGSRAPEQTSGYFHGAQLKDLLAVSLLPIFPLAIFLKPSAPDAPSSPPPEGPQEPNLSAVTEQFRAKYAEQFKRDIDVVAPYFAAWGISHWSGLSESDRKPLTPDGGLSQDIINRAQLAFNDRSKPTFSSQRIAWIVKRARVFAWVAANESAAAEKGFETIDKRVGEIIEIWNRLPHETKNENFGYKGGPIPESFLAYMKEFAANGKDPFGMFHPEPAVQPEQQSEIAASAAHAAAQPAARPLPPPYEIVQVNFFKRLSSVWKSATERMVQHIQTVYGFRNKPFAVLENLARIVLFRWLISHPENGPVQISGTFPDNEFIERILRQFEDRKTAAAYNLPSREKQELDINQLEGKIRDLLIRKHLPKQDADYIARLAFLAFNGPDFQKSDYSKFVLFMLFPIYIDLLVNDLAPLKIAELDEVWKKMSYTLQRAFGYEERGDSYPKLFVDFMLSVAREVGDLNRYFAKEEPQPASSFSSWLLPYRRRLLSMSPALNNYPLVLKALATYLANEHDLQGIREGRAALPSVTSQREPAVPVPPPAAPVAQPETPVRPKKPKTRMVLGEDLSWQRVPVSSTPRRPRSAAPRHAQAPSSETVSLTQHNRNVNPLSMAGGPSRTRRRPPVPPAVSSAPAVPAAPSVAPRKSSPADTANYIITLEVFDHVSPNSRLVRNLTPIIRDVLGSGMRDDMLDQNSIIAMAQAIIFLWQLDIVTKRTDIKLEELSDAELVPPVEFVRNHAGIFELQDLAKLPVQMIAEEDVSRQMNIALISNFPNPQIRNYLVELLPDGLKNSLRILNSKTVELPPVLRELFTISFARLKQRELARVWNEMPNDLRVAFGRPRRGDVYPQAFIDFMTAIAFREGNLNFYFRRHSRPIQLKRLSSNGPTQIQVEDELARLNPELWYYHGLISELARYLAYKLSPVAPQAPSSARDASEASAAPSAAPSAPVAAVSAAPQSPPERQPDHVISLDMFKSLHENSRLIRSVSVKLIEVLGSDNFDAMSDTDNLVSMAQAVLFLWKLHLVETRPNVALGHLMDYELNPTYDFVAQKAKQLTNWSVVRQPARTIGLAQFSREMDEVLKSVNNYVPQIRSYLIKLILDGVKNYLYNSTPGMVDLPPALVNLFATRFAQFKAKELVVAWDKMSDDLRAAFGPRDWDNYPQAFIDFMLSIRNGGDLNFYFRRHDEPIQLAAMHANDVLTPKYAGADEVRIQVENEIARSNPGLRYYHELFSQLAFHLAYERREAKASSEPAPVTQSAASAVAPVTAPAAPVTPTPPAAEPEAGASARTSAEIQRLREIVSSRIEEFNTSVGLRIPKFDDVKSMLEKAVHSNSDPLFDYARQFLWLSDRGKYYFIQLAIDSFAHEARQAFIAGKIPGDFHNFLKDIFSYRYSLRNRDVRKKIEADAAKTQWRKQEKVIKEVSDRVNLQSVRAHNGSRLTNDDLISAAVDVWGMLEPTQQSWFVSQTISTLVARPGSLPPAFVEWFIRFVAPEILRGAAPQGGSTPAAQGGRGTGGTPAPRSRSGSLSPADETSPHVSTVTGLVDVEEVSTVGGLEIPAMNAAPVTTGASILYRRQIAQRPAIRTVRPAAAVRPAVFARPAVPTVHAF